MLTIQDILESKNRSRLCALTAYDYPTAKIFDKSGIDLLLVGDSLGMVVLGYTTTREVTLDDMIRHGAAVVRGAPSTFIVVDMPAVSMASLEVALDHAKKIIDLTHAHSLKVEGHPELVSKLVTKGFSVMGHTGLKPQSALRYGLKGRDPSEAEVVFQEALALESAGVYALVLECVPVSLARKITRALRIPVIGIGAGNECDGQILVGSDMIGLFPDFKPKFVRRYADVATQMETAVRQFQSDVKHGRFPSEAESFL